MKIKKAPSQQQRVMTQPTVETRVESTAAPITRTEHERPKRAERVPFGQASLRLSSTSIPGMHLHWVNDWHPQMTDRLNQAEAAGYEFVTQSEVQTAMMLGGRQSTDLGSRVSRIVGTRPDGVPITAYLMKIPEEWFREHQQPVWDRADKIDGAIRSGQFERQKDDNRYVPRQTPISLTTELKQGESDG